MKIIILTVLLFTLTSATYAGDFQKRENIERLLKLTNVDEIVDVMYSQVEQMMVGVGEQLGVKPTEQKYLDEYFLKITKLMKEDMSWEKMKEPIIQVYMDNFNEEEVQDMVIFYSSKSGKSVVKKLPKIMQDSIHISQELMANFIPKV